MDHELPLPDYALKLLAEQGCTKCAAAFSRDQVTHIGICRYRDAHRFFYVVTCPACETPVTIVVTTRGIMTVERMAEELGGQVPREDEDPPATADDAHSPVLPDVQPHQGPIDDEEVEQFLKALDEAKTHEAFLLEIGLTPKEIRKYRRRRRKGP